MKKTFRQLARDLIDNHALSGSDCRAVLAWFGASSIYFPTEQDKRRAQDALVWMYRNTPAGDSVPFDRCIAAFSEKFGLPLPDSERLFAGFSDRADTVQPVMIGIEGLDGSGKTVQAKRLCQILEQSGKRVCLIDFPQYSGFFGKEIGALLSDTDGVSAMELDEKSMCLWYALDRRKTIDHAQIGKYDYVIFNRYTLSNVVYQSARRYRGLRQEFVDWIFELEHIQLALPVPDIYIYLNTRSDLSGENVLRKGQREYVDGLDVYERSQDLLSCCHGIYQKLADEIDEIKFLECMDDKGSLRGIEEINADIIANLTKYGLF